MAEWGLTYWEFVFVFSYTPHESSQLRWERFAPDNCLLEFEQAVYDGVSPKQLCGRFSISSDTYRGLLKRLGLGGRVKSKRWSAAEKAAFKEWVEEGCDSAELASRAHRRLGRTISRDRASEIRAEITGVKRVYRSSANKPKEVAA
jgi:hypothetical protein